MAFQCGFFNSINGDRKYNAEQMNNPYSRIVSNGVFANNENSTDFQVQAVGGLNIVIKKGDGIFASKWAKLDADMPMTIPTPSVNQARIDSIIIRIDISDSVRAGTIEYKQGIPSSSPVAIELESSATVKEYRLAKITINPNVTSITQAQIEDCRPTGECGFITNLLQNSDITATYSQWQEQFEQWFIENKDIVDEWFASSQNTFEENQNENQESFDAWFENLKTTLTSVTAISSFSSRYITTEQDETEIPINISRYNSVLDILQVYINGLILVPDVDYTISDFNTIILTNGVDAGTQISFIVYKSVDGSEAESVVRLVDQLSEKNEELKSQVEILEEKIEQLESKTDEPLWVGASLMGQGENIAPTKKLSECKNGWILVWSDYDETTGTANNSQIATNIIPKQIAPTSSYYCIVASGINANGTVTSCGKSLSVSDSSISGYAGNNATADGIDVCLKAIYEF